MSYDYDLFVLGAGSGGLAAAKRAASHGAKVAIAENSRAGGTCVIRGCIPKKVMVYASHFAEQARMAEHFGWAPSPLEHDWSKLAKNRNDLVNRLEKMHERYLAENEVELIRGTARLMDVHTVEVEGKCYSAKYILLATGARPELPALKGIEHALSSDGFFELEQKPTSAVIVGGGYIAVEFAGILAGLGIKTHLLVRSILLRGFDREIADELERALIRQGVDVVRPVTVHCVEKSATGVRVLYDEGNVEDAGTPASLESDACVVFATGRTPNTSGIGLEKVGVQLGKHGAVIVDEDHVTSVENIFAVGDVLDRANLTPVAIKAGRSVADRVFGNINSPMSYENIPTAVFSQPPIGTVGLTEEEAREEFGDRVRVYRAGFVPLYFSLAPEEEKGRAFMKMIVDSETDRVLGLHMIGEDAAEIIQGFAVAVCAGLTKAQFDQTVAIHPSTAEEFVLLR